MVSRLEFLVNIIKESSKAYYETSNPIMSDIQFDSYIEELRNLDPNNEVLTESNWGAELTLDINNKVKHPVKMTGISDKRKFETITEKSFPNTPMIISLKCDGVSARVYFKKDSLAINRIVTRGDYEYGVDITDKVSNLIHNNGVINNETDIEWIRCEIVIKKCDFKESFGYPTPLSMVVGLLNSNNPNPEHLKLLTIVLFEVKRLKPTNIEQQYFDIKSVSRLLKIEAVPSSLTTLYDISKPLNIVKYLSKNRDSIEIPSDGCVVLSEKGQFAIKFEDEKFKVKVTDVKIQLSTKGKLIPVIEFEPIEILGTTITRCSGFNMKKVIEEKINIGAEIEIIKANQVIPHWVSTVKSSDVDILAKIDKEYPGWYYKGVDICIPVDLEKESVKKLLLEYSVHGLSEKSIEWFMSTFNIYTHEKLYDFMINGTLNTHVMSAKVVINKIGETFKNIMSSLTISKLFYCLNLPSLGMTNSMLLQSYFMDNLMDLFNFSKVTLKESVRLKNKNIIDELTDNSKFVEKVFNIWKPYLKLTQIFIPKIKKVRACLTGAYHIKRKDFLKKYNLEEATVNEADIVIHSSEDIESSKYKKALKLNKHMVTYEEFEEKSHFLINSILYNS